MLTFGGFTGINNVLPEHRQGASDLRRAENVNIGLTGEITRRGGFTEVSDQCHKNLWQADGFMLATCGSVLTAIHPDGARHVIHPALGYARVWYCNLPDGRTTFTNGLIQGVTDGLVGAERSIPSPVSLGIHSAAFGALHAGEYRYYLTHVRLGDRLEGPAISSGMVEISDGGLRLVSSPALYDGGNLFRLTTQMQPMSFGAHAALHPDDAARLGLQAEDAVQVRNDHGSISLAVKLEPAVKPGTVWIPASITGAPVGALLNGGLEVVRVEK